MLIGIIFQIQHEYVHWFVYLFQLITLYWLKVILLYPLQSLGTHRGWVPKLKMWHAYNYIYICATCRDISKVFDCKCIWMTVFTISCSFQKKNESSVSWFVNRREKAVAVPTFFQLLGRLWIHPWSGLDANTRVFPLPAVFGAGFLYATPIARCVDIKGGVFLTPKREREREREREQVFPCGSDLNSGSARNHRVLKKVVWREEAKKKPFRRRCREKALAFLEAAAN